MADLVTKAQNAISAAIDVLDLGPLGLPKWGEVLDDVVGEKLYARDNLAGLIRPQVLVTASRKAPNCSVTSTGNIQVVTWEKDDSGLCLRSSFICTEQQRAELLNELANQEREHARVMEIDRPERSF